MHFGGKPALLDKRDRSFHRSFGTVNKPMLDLGLPEEYNVDAGLTMPDQNQLDPYSCTAYTTCDMGTDQDGIIYGPKYTYMKTLFMQGLPPTTNGSDIRPALKSAKVFGLLPADDVPHYLRDLDEDESAKVSNWPIGLDAISGKLEHRKGDYYNIYDDGGLDWYDSFKSALWLNREDKRAASVGTPWFWNSAPMGFVNVLSSDIERVNADPWAVGWHNWKLCGWKKINGKEYLIGKPWQGKNYGDHGWVYFSRESINNLMEIRGSIAFTQKDASPEDIKTIQLGILETVLLFIARMLGRARYA